jgi:hypothetical protein
MQVELTKTDRAYAHQHGLTDGEMRAFVEDQIREEEMMKTYYELQERERIDCENSPQSAYVAW